MNKEKLQIALAILSGRKKPRDLDIDELIVLGYDDHGPRWHGVSSNEILERAEEIVFNVFCQLLDKEN